MSHPLFDLTNRVALVSGAASGLGKAMATAFAEAGAHVVLADINPAGNAATASELAALGHRALPHWHGSSKAFRRHLCEALLSLWKQKKQNSRR